MRIRIRTFASYADDCRFNVSVCGMSFADLAHLEKSALDRNVLQYNRIKTKTPMSLEILESAKEMMNQLRSNKPALPDCPDYLFDILHSDKKRKDEKHIRNISLLFVDLIIV